MLCFLCVSGAAVAAPEGSNDAPPSAEFLEFLGEWQTKQGQLIDPFDLKDDERQESSSKPVEGKKHD